MQVTHHGIGGAGNVRSRSRDPTGERRAAEADRERVVLLLREEERAGKVVRSPSLARCISVTHADLLQLSTGRGGAGNISRSRSRGPGGSQSSDATLGRGTGNAVSGVERGTGYDLQAEIE